MNEKEEGKKDTKNDGSSDFFVFSSFEYLEYEETDGTSASSYSRTGNSSKITKHENDISSDFSVGLYPFCPDLTV